MRLLIPAAMAAAATYAALVRDEARQAEAWVPAGPTGPGATPDGSAPAAAYIPPSESVPTPPASSAAAPTGFPVRPPSPYADLAESPTAEVSRPSVYDLLAGAPEAVAAEPRIPSVPGVESVRDIVPPDVSPPVPAQEALGAAVTEIPQPVVVPPPMAAAAEPADEWMVPLEEGRFALGGYAAGSGHSIVSAVTFRRRLPSVPEAAHIVLEIDASENTVDGGLVVLADPGFAPDRDGFTLLLAAKDPGPFSAAGSYRVTPKDEEIRP